MRSLNYIRIATSALEMFPAQSFYRWCQDLPNSSMMSVLLFCGKEEKADTKRPPHLAMVANQKTVKMGLKVEFTYSCAVDHWASMQVLIFEELALSYTDFSCKGFRFLIYPSSPEILELSHNQISLFVFVQKVETQRPEWGEHFFNKRKASPLFLIFFVYFPP